MIDIQPIGAYNRSISSETSMRYGRISTMCKGKFEGIQPFSKEYRMKLTKITCLQCPQYDGCSQKTRMFVNYCGSKVQSVERHIKEAISECRAKHGYLLTSVLFSSDSEKSYVKKLDVSPQHP